MVTSLKMFRNITLVLDGPDAGSARTAMMGAPDGVDAFELRIDLLGKDDRTVETVTSLVRNAPAPVVVTCRAESEGGAWTSGDSDREALLKAGLDAGAALVDIESSWVERDRDLPARFPESRVMVSHHDWDGMPKDAGDLLTRLAAVPARAVKLVVRARNFSDLMWLDAAATQLQRIGRHAACFAVGPFARTSRILSGLAGAHLIYVRGGSDSPASPDLLSLDEAVNLYRLGDLPDPVKVLGVLGHPVRHSLSPLMHNRVIRTLGERYIYVPFDSPDPEPVIEYARTHDVRGLSVTIPHKVAVMPMLDGLDETARDAGAVNTIVPRGRALIGHNTDLIACRVILREWSAGKKDRAVLIGAGGAARSVARALNEFVVPFVVLNRDEARGRRLAEEFGVSYGGPPSAAAKLDGSLFINATPAGSRDDVPELRIPAVRGRSFLDLAYQRGDTRLIREARAAGCRTVGGLDFLARQGACQFALWTRRIVNIELFREALEKSGAGAVQS